MKMNLSKNNNSSCLKRLRFRSIVQSNTTLLFTFFAMLLITSCGEDFLDRQPIIGSVEEDFYNTEEDAISAVNAAYATLQFELSPAGHFRWFWGDIMSDDSDKGGDGDGDAFELLKLEQFQGATNTDFLQGEWEANYEGIYRANKVLENVPNIEMNGQTKSEILGEALALRAYFHYNLVTIFGNIPVVDHVLLPSEYNIAQSSPSEAWALIESDLKTAILDLPLRSEYPLTDLGRITKGMAQSLLGKAYMYQGKYTEAQAAFEDVVGSAEYELVPDYGTIWTEAGENNIESIFEIQYMNASGGNWGRNNANEGTFSNVFMRARGDFGGFGFNIPTQDLIDEFFVEGFEDPRLQHTVFRIGDEMGDRGVFTIDATGGFPHEYYQKKIFNSKSEEAPFGDPVPNGGTNDRIIRYADVLLMHAEAAARNGNDGAAQTSLNAVRARVGLDPVTSTGSQLLNAIYHERRVELAMEGHRFFDLIRSGRAAEVLGPLGYQEGVHNLFPIPQFEITKSNGVYSQNPGY